MNRRPSGSMPLLTALTGFLNYKLAEGAAERTVDQYERIIRKWADRQGDLIVQEISAKNIRDYLNWLRTEYQPVRKNGKTHPLSPKTIRNVWVCFSAFFSWATIEFDINNPMENIPAPKVNQKPVNAFSREEIEKLLKACKYTRRADTEYRMSFQMQRPSAKRDRAMILVLLDTGMRASELCALRIDDVDLKSGKIEIRHGAEGKAKGGKGRTVFLGKVARNSLWRYLSSREDGDEPDAPVFVTNENRKMNPNSLRLLVKRLAEKAEIKEAYPHKFRHTFAITYLRSGGDVFTLQALLGHSTLDMVRHYAQIAEMDIKAAHRRASPADNWRL